MFRIIVLSAAIIVLCAAGVYFYHQYTLGLISEDVAEKNQAFYVSGYVGHKKAMSGQWHALSRDSEIADGDSIKTAESSGVDIRFGKDKKSVISVSENTHIEFNRIAVAGDKYIKLDHGTLLADLKELDSESKFQIRTPTAVCGVLGTSFEAQAIDGQTIIRVFEGRVYVKGVGVQSIFGEKFIVPEGSQTRILKSHSPERPIPLSSEDLARWKQWKEDMPYRAFRTFYVFYDEDNVKNHYYPSGWLGDYDAIRRVIWEDNPYSGNNCLRFQYTGRTPQGAGWVGVYWQNPVNNWGDVKGGFNLVGAKKISFWARGEEGGEIITKFGIGGISGIYPDSDKAEIGPVILTKDWKEYVIRLEGKDLSAISGGFYWITDKNSNPDGAILYLDNIKFE